MTKSLDTIVHSYIRPDCMGRASTVTRPAISTSDTTTTVQTTGTCTSESRYCTDTHEVWLPLEQAHWLLTAGCVGGLMAVTSRRFRLAVRLVLLLSSLIIGHFLEPLSNPYESTCQTHETGQYSRAGAARAYNFHRSHKN